MGLNHCFSFCACVIVGYVCFYFLFLFFLGGNLWGKGCAQGLRSDMLFAD